MKLERRLLVSLLILLTLSVSFCPLSAQTAPLSQFARTLDGTISVHLPAGWMSQDTATSVFTSAFAFGDNAASLQELLGTLTGGETALTTPHSNGLIGIVDTRLTSGLSTQLAITSLLQGIIQDLTPQGARILEQQSTLLGGQFSASLIVVEIPARSAKGFVGVFETPLGIAEVSLGAVPQRNFDSLRPQLEAILNSIRIPAEEATAVQPPAVEPNPVAQPIETAGGLIRSPNHQFSVGLSANWMSHSVQLEGFNDVVAFGSTQAAADAITTLITEGTGIETFAGVGGLIGVVDSAQLDPTQVTEATIAPLMQQMLGSIESDDVQVIEQPADHTFGGAYPGQLALTSIGYLGVLFANQQFVIVLVVTDALDAHQAEMLAIIETIRIPAADVGSVAPLINETITVRAAQDSLSVELPANWVTLDFVATNDAFAFGDSDQAAQTRLASANPQLAESGAISGLGGLILLYDAAAVNLDPAQPNLTALMDQVVSGLQGQGYRVIEAAQPVTIGANTGLVVQIAGTEQGYLALVLFGDQLAYITATGTPNNFAQNDALLLGILQSIRIPAVADSSGLGGLSGLGSNATPTPPGLGGLGGS
jgi:hypothetical protein